MVLLGQASGRADTWSYRQHVAVGPYFAIFFAKFRPFFEEKKFAKFSEI
jgi:hypothetical protein